MAHHYILGGSGTGKSTLQKNIILEAINADHGVCFIDPHGHDIDDLMLHMPADKIPKTILFDPTDPDYYLSWNLLDVGADINLTTSILTDTIKDISGFNGSPTAQMEMVLRATIRTLIQQKKTIADILDLLDNPKGLETVDFKNDVLTSFWKDYVEQSKRDRRATRNSTYNKFFGLLIDDRIRRILSVKKGHFSLKDAVNDKILLIRLPQGQLGMSITSLIGSLSLSLIHLACMQRDTTVPYHIVVSEVQNYSDCTISEMLSALRKFNVNIYIEHHFTKEISDKFFDSLMGNCEHKHVFRVSPDDAIRFQKPLHNYQDINLFDLPNFHYRTFPWHNRDTDTVVEPPEGKGKSTTPISIKNYTRQFYCERIEDAG